MILSPILRFVLCGAVCAPALAQFPVVTPVVQQARDGLRRDILATELATEQAALAAARTADDRHRHAQNIEALRRELAPLGGVATPEPRVLARAMVQAPAATTPEPPAPFWDTYRRPAPSTVLPTTAKETP